MRQVFKKKSADDAPKSKYNAQKTVFNIKSETLSKKSAAEIKAFKDNEFDPALHIIFDSTKEAEFYRDKLLPKIKVGAITVRFQPKFTLLEKSEKGGIKHQAITYTPDFEVSRPNGRVTYIDVKGMEDQKFTLKRKMFDAKFPELPPLLVMKYVRKFGGWITIEEYVKQKRAENKAKKEG